MKESFLQEKLLEMIKDESFLESIKNTDSLEEALKIDSDPSTIPEFSIDHLLKRKYSKSAMKVLHTLKSYEIISGDQIKNISLNKDEKLFPDCLLFNYETNEIIIIENKTDSQTEREALTELFGYSQEIRNCLPFISDYDISYILISTEFNTLLDHSVSSQIICSEINILCLKPFVKDEIFEFEVHFPSSWSNIGQNGLPKGSLISYTMCLKKKSVEDIPSENIIQQAIDLLAFDAFSNRTSGFCILWENGLNRLDETDGFDYGITIYIINSFVFLPNAIELGFDVNLNSKLAKFILDKIKESGIIQTPNSLFSISEKAQKLLEKYFNVTWDRNTTWEQDIKDEFYKIQRFPIHTESWGVIGEFVKYYYYHPAVKNHLLLSTSIEKSNPNNPLVCLQIINIITGNSLFRHGHFYFKDIFHFGIQLFFYDYSCRNSLETDKSKIIINESLLFWNNLPLLNSLNEIRLRVLDSTHIGSEDTPKLRIYFRKESVKEDYKEYLEQFVNWFENKFIGGNRIHIDVFKIGYICARYFNYYFSKELSPSQNRDISNNFNAFVKNILSSIITSHKNKSHILREEVICLINQISDIDLDNTPEHDILKKINDTNYNSSVIIQILDILDFTFGELLHPLKKIFISDSIDFNWLKDSALKRFESGNKYTALEITSNGTVALVELDGRYRLMGELATPEDIFLILNPASGMPMIIKKKWDEIIKGGLN